MLKASFDQECTFKANVLFSFRYTLVCSMEQPRSTETGVFLGKTKTKNICQELIDCAVTIASTQSKPQDLYWVMSVPPDGTTTL